jgi:steroid delta-isomerase-like uncharacterized protein
MPAGDNEQLARRFFEAQDEMRGGPDSALCTEDYTARIGDNPPMTLKDHEGFAAAFYSGFPDLHHTVEETVAADDRVAFRFTLRGTHRGDFMGIPPTQKSFQATGVGIFQIVEGRISNVRGVFDQFGMMRQLGVVP